ncbi:CaiB/BaiF CoA transferase family protein [Pseudonocardia sp.]|jgi:crotonobetainyl-CoA:carnitine CoA-transferase CaiB-like acyl-CoA transferase|uniref:CaiB/BaiF CoA transferase family protein n=1 Tax=Pseudonocardia sp. TaxID=60912 RepID=UPI003D13020F
MRIADRRTDSAASDDDRQEGAGPGALEGLKVLDLTRFWAGPALTEVLGNMGADVIKIEAIQAPDWWRAGGARLTVTGDDRTPGYEISPLYNAVNRNKFGVTLDLTRDAGRDVFRRMVAEADVVVENYTPRVMERFGLDYANLAAINPRMTMISLPAYGMTGPWRDFVGFAYPTEQSAGFPPLTGYPDDGPSLWGCAGADCIAGMIGLVGLMAALCWTQRSGSGQHIDLSQMEAISTFLGAPMIDYGWNGRTWARIGNADTLMAPQGCYPAVGSDRWVVVSVGTDEEWQALCRLLDRNDWAERTDLADYHGRFEAQLELDAGIGAWTSGRTDHEAAQQLQAAGVAAAPVLSGVDFLTDPHLAARSFITYVDRVHVGRQAHTEMWAKFSRTPASIRMPAPTLGEHNERILRELAGVDAAELEALRAEQIIGSVPTVLG